MKDRITPAIALVFMGAVWFLYGFQAFVLCVGFGACCFILGAKDCAEEDK